jgi:hypothetical protein
MWLCGNAAAYMFCFYVVSGVVRHAVRPVMFALIQYMRTEKQDMTKLIVAFFSSFPKTPNVIFEKDVRNFSL